MLKGVRKTKTGMDGTGKKKTLFDPDDLSAQPGQVAQVSSVDPVKCVIVHLGEDSRVGWLVVGRLPEIVSAN